MNISLEYESGALRLKLRLFNSGRRRPPTPPHGGGHFCNEINVAASTGGGLLCTAVGLIATRLARRFVNTGAILRGPHRPDTDFDSFLPMCFSTSLKNHSFFFMFQAKRNFGLQSVTLSQKPLKCHSGHSPQNAPQNTPLRHLLRVDLASGPYIPIWDAKK